MIGAIPAAVGEARGALTSCTTTAGRLVCTSTTGAGIAVGVLVIIYLVILVVVILAYVRIITKAGYSGWWVLIALVPIVNIVMFLVFAFSEWPIQREVARLRSQGGYQGGGGYASREGYGGTPGSWVGDRGIMLGTPASSTPPTAGPMETYGAQPDTSGSSGIRSAEADLPSFAQGPSPATAGGSGPGDEVNVGSSPGASGAPSPADPGTQSTQPADTGSAPAGWYPTPDGRRRYWDGAAWTDHFA